MLPSSGRSLAEHLSAVSSAERAGIGARASLQQARSGPGAILAIDYGRRRLGLAVSDELRMTARPLATWNRTNRRADLARLRELCRERQLNLIVIGLPLHLDGAAGEMAREARLFADRLRKYAGLPVELTDERLSSWEAEQSMTKPNPRGGGRKRTGPGVDAVAAAIILRDYLSSRANAARRVERG